ncbi:hypothetical protein CK203_104924 [Vitis vinifera]|uniref:Retrotransposon gag domain-containing protein n=1 Tax=Vitis vinifera TaxID=29760 RepID=A0A438BN33_VITVI|nr:hypothetical protein CK203_104924 [Vitis vinifera]
MEIYTKISEEKYPKVSVATIGKLQENFAGAQNGCEISQPKADFAALRNWPSAWSDMLPMATSGSAPKVAEMTVIKNVSWQIFSLLPLLAFRICLWQRTSKLCSTTPPPPVQSAPQVGAFVLHDRTETTPHSIVAPAQIVDDTQARIDRIEQRMRSLHVFDGIISWDGYDDLPVAALPVEFRMPDIERYTGIGCPRIHLELCSTVMRGHRLDEAQMIMLFPLSLSGAAQRWFASLDPSRRRTWADLGQEFIR